jgi:acyl-CoA synthetase (AMP-forming)/AMP-acid ligase II
VNISRAAKNAALRYKDRAAILSTDGQFTYAQFDELVDRLASALRKQAAAGSRVALMLTNGLPAVLLHFAIPRAGLVRVPINARYTAYELKKIVDHCAASLIFYDRHTEECVDQAKSQIESDCVFVRTEADDRDWHACLSCDIDPDLLHQGGADDLATINYTSGTTGNPKGVMLSHRNWQAVYANLLIDRDLRGDDVVAHVGPLSHATGTYLEAWYLTGARNLIIEPTAEALCEAIEKYRVTAFTCVPTFLSKLVQHPRLNEIDCSSLRLIGYGAEAISANTLQKAWDRFGPILWQNYGQTEAMVTCVHLPPGDHVQDVNRKSLRQGYIGRPYTFVDIALRDVATGVPVADGQIGELTVRAEHVMKGYWNQPEETAKAVRDGWLWTGDLAIRDETGLIRLVGRSKDMLICGGFNIYPQEIETTLTSCEDVMQAAVVAQADATWGEIPVAFVVLKEDCKHRGEELTALFKPILGIKTPKKWFVLDDFPKNINGKIDKKQLKNTYIQSEMADGRS